jgi:hypothetical protein
VRRVGVLLNPGPGDAEMQTRMPRLCRDYNSWAGESGTPFRSTTVGVTAILIAFVAMWQNWLASDRTLCKLGFDVLSRDPHVHLRSRATGRELEPVSQDQVAAVSRVVPTPI